MKKVDIRFICGVRRKIHRFLYTPTEEQAIQFIEKERPRIAREWGVSTEKVDVEIVHVIRLK